MSKFSAETVVRELAGSRGSARIPVSRALINDLLVKALSESRTPLRAVDVRPHAGDIFEAVVTVSWPFVPALTVRFTIEQQPVFPASPVLVLSWSFLGAAGALASRIVSSLEKLPAGVRLDGHRLLLDIAVLAADLPLAPMLIYIRALELHTLDGRFVFDVELAIPE